MFFGKDFIFVHIPKCAGTFIRDYLKSQNMGKSNPKWHVPISEIGVGKREVISSIRNPMDYYSSLYEYHKKKPHRVNNRWYNYWSPYEDFTFFE
jgi:hypothetical protein